MTMADNPFIFIAGPCVLESEALAVEIAGRLKEMTQRLPLRFVFKASYDKANRTALDSHRGPGITEGLRMLAQVKRQIGVEVLSDVHESAQVAEAAAVLDVIQIPAFLMRQTDLIVAAARSGKIVNIKKAQFAAPEDLRYAVDKATAQGNAKLWLTERGTTFGYHNLVVDFRSFSLLRALGHPVIFDATHSVQRPALGGKSGGDRQFVAPLARAAAAYGIDGFFTETHPNPDSAPSDGANMLRLDDIPQLLDQVLTAREAALKLS